MTAATVLPTCVRCGWVRERNAGRGLCGSCWRAAEQDGTLLDYPRATRTAADVAEDYAIAVLRLPHATIAERAVFMGMTPSALKRALERARARARADARVTELRPATAVLEPSTVAA